MNLFNSALRDAMAKLYGDVRAPNSAHKKAGRQPGFKEEETHMASVPQNPMMEIPLRKAYGSEFVRITPAIAQHWLSYNTANRRIVKGSLDKIVTAIERGEWKENGETICFAPGKLLDGQNRLTAIALTGETLRILVVHGLDPEVQSTMDTGRVRTTRDVLSIEGLGIWESNILSTAIHTVMAHDRGLTVAANIRFDNTAARNYYLEHQSALDASLRALHELPRKPSLLPFSRALALHVLFARLDAEAADNFFGRLYIGDGLAKSSPIFHLRTRLMNDMVTKTHRSSFVECMYLIRAWNAVRSHTQWKTPTGLYAQGATELPEIK